jgi:hypothetical protein
MQSLIFLDIDGVLNRHRPWPNGYIGIEPACAYRFNRLLKLTGAKIVVSSAWRYLIHSGSMTTKGFENLLLSHGINCHDRVIGLTEPDAESWKDERGIQIYRWLEGKPRCPYVVIDDLDLGITAAGHPFVETLGNHGLRWCDVRLAVQLLEEQKTAATV